MEQPHLTPNWMPVHRLIHQASGGDVHTVMVDGRIVLENRRVLMVDEPESLSLARAEAAALVARSGLEQYMHDPGWGQLYRTFER